MSQTERPTYEIMLDKNCDGITVLYQRYGQKLYGYGMYTWKISEDDNWDLVYKTLYKVHEKVSVYKFDSEKGFAAIVYKIYINYLRKQYRKKQQVEEHLSFTNFNESLFEGTEDNRGLKTESTIKKKIVERDLAEERDRDKPQNPKLVILEEELEKFEDWQRMLLLLKGQNMPYAEIAKYIDKPAGQLKVYYQRLKKKLMKRMNERLLGLNIN